MFEEILDKTYQFVKTYHQNDHSGHDFEHIKRVYANLLKLLEETPQADEFVAKMSALLHDVDDHKLNTDGKNAERFLRSLPLDEACIRRILETIDAISFSKSGANPVFKTLEMKLLSDADKLDAMGAIGICRAVSFGASRGRVLFNEKALPVLENYKTHTINHFFEKLLVLKNAMQTDIAKREAEKRHKFMVLFLQEFFAEQNLEEWIEVLEEYLKKV